METSLAPSPMAKVIADGSSLFINLTTSAFYPGDTRQHTTPSHDLAILMKLTLYSILAKIKLRAPASTSKPLFC